MAQVALTIAGSDSGGGAGIQADLLTFASFGLLGTCAITAVTAQNPDAVAAVEPISTANIRQQIEQIDAYFKIDAVKTGLLPNAATIKTVAQWLDNKAKSFPLVVDPVVTATSGAIFLDELTLEALKQYLLPKASLITPNLDEVKILLGEHPKNVHMMKQSALQLTATYGCATLVKGGHLPGDKLIDILYEPDGSLTHLEAQRISPLNTHGSGCTLASAIAAGLGKGLNLQEAFRQAHHYLQKLMSRPVLLGKEYGFALKMMQ